MLTHWGQVTHICVSKLTNSGSDNDLWPGRRQAVIWTNAGILLIWPLGTNFNEILIEMYIFSFKKMHLKMLSVKWHPLCLGINVLTSDIMQSNITHLCILHNSHKKYQLEQLERLRSEDTPCRLMITHTIESYWIPSQTRATVTPRNPSADRLENGVLNQWATSRISDLMSHVSHKQTRPRSWLKVRPYQVWLRLEKKCTRESGNRLRRSIN